uniref:NADH-ubiquinone oxidoreductase chain 6 n=1 Tax=Neobythites unimaculatus TaxID=1188027 RepID=A0A7I6NCY3_9TELE|nr:NADH dehydrogenase subunit 6 [Neobythites unimaculatus]
MTFLMWVCIFGLVLGLAAVASNPTPYFAALGLVVVAVMGCGVLWGHGGPFLSLVLLLIYLGGMLVVFAYSAALAAEPYPYCWGNFSVMTYLAGYVLGLGLAIVLLWGVWYEATLVPADELDYLSVSRGDMGGVAVLYSLGGGMLTITALVLLIALFVVLEVVRGLSRGALRAI